MLKKTAILACCLLSFASRASGIDEAYQALGEYDYFKAKKLFYKLLTKEPARASFGLAVIFSRHDNPFMQVDSAAKYMALCRQAPVAASKQPVPVHPSMQAVDSLSGLIGSQGYTIYLSKTTIASAETFLRAFYFAPAGLKAAALRQRDSLRLLTPKASGSSDSLVYFMAHYPESVFWQDARRIYELYVFREQVRENTSLYLEPFILHYPSSPYRLQAEELLFKTVKDSHDPAKVYDFIRRYSSGLTAEQAWKYLYSLSVTHYSEKALQAFLAAYPDYPYRQTVQDEITLSATVLIPLKNSRDQWGYIDTLGNWQIMPAFDDAAGFSEGFAAVCANDTCFYIDKQGRKASPSVFSEVSDYHRGVAVVKQHAHYFLINRTGQLISQPYDDISDCSDNLYVARQGNRYGAINRRGSLVIPAVYDKLGDFKKGFAYYMSAGYGLIDTLNHAYAAGWDWISDVDSNGIVIVKRGHAFGLIRAPEQVIMEPDYDYIKPCGNHVFLLVKNNLYGFYDAAGRCFITGLEFDYEAQHEPSYYSNGKLFKRVEDGEVSLVDANGRVSINEGKYEDIFFAKEDMIRILKNDKYGFTDRKLKIVIRPDYDKASDFENGRAIVQKKDQVMLVDKSGKAVFTCRDCELRAFDKDYLLATGDLKGLIDANGGEVLKPVYTSLERIGHSLTVARNATGIYLFDERTKAIKKLSE